MFWGSDANNPEAQTSVIAWGATTPQATDSHFKKTCSFAYHQKMTEQTYNGWKNYETWNVTLWLQNDEVMYELACLYVKTAKHSKIKNIYDSMIPALEINFSKITPDGVRWMDPKICTAEVDRMLAELAE